MTGSFEAIQFLKDSGLCHGDIRNDHIIIERKSKRFVWIDFDLWSLGNILNFVVGKGIRTFHEVYSSGLFSQQVRDNISEADASAFWQYRVMNLKKLYPYIPDALNDILLHFTVSTDSYYTGIGEVIRDLMDALTHLPPARVPQ